MDDHAAGEEEVRRVVDTVTGLEAVEDPADRARRAAKLLEEWPQQHTRLREIRQQAVKDMRAAGVSYRKIASEIGVSLGRVQQIEAGETESRNRTRKKSAGEADQA